MMNRSLITLRSPRLADGAAIWRLAAATRKLDANSVYAYLMMCDMFGDTCAVASIGDRLVGFVTAFLKPAQPETLFVWQIGVDPTLQGSGIGTRLLEFLLEQEELEGVNYVEATIGPDNDSSRWLFLRLADKHGTQCHVTKHYEVGLFPSEQVHDAELLFRIGPLLTDQTARANLSDKEVVQ